MQKKLVLKILIVIIAVALLLKLVTLLLIEPWLIHKIEREVNHPPYAINIANDHISIFPPKIGFDKVSISLISLTNQEDSLKLDIDHIQIAGIYLLNYLFTHRLEANTLYLSDVTLSGKIPPPQKIHKIFLSPVDLSFKTIRIKNLNTDVSDSAAFNSLLVKSSGFYVDKFLLQKGHPLSSFTADNIDFSTPNIGMVSRDSMYTYAIDSIDFSMLDSVLSIGSFRVIPNYKNYVFSARLPYQSDRIDGDFRAISINGFSSVHLLREGHLTCSSIRVTKMDLDIFRDRHKPFHHTIKPVFQDILFAFPMIFTIDSLHILDGSIKYTEHAADANKPGYIFFDNTHILLNTISNDPLSPVAGDTLKLNAEAQLYGNTKIRMYASGKIFDAHHTFNMNGLLSSMPASGLNPILEKNAFIYAWGKVKSLGFNFTANEFSSNGQVRFLYDDLAITLKNKASDDTTGFKERVLTTLANKKILDANPLPKEEARTGTIFYERDPEKMFFNYALKSILSGVKSSVDKASKKKKKE